MRRIFTLILFIVMASPAVAQINELGVFLGGSNYIGDVGPDAYVKPNEFAYGVLYKWNRSPRHSYRISYVQSKITARDEESKSDGRKLRDFDFENDIKEISAGLEFNFFEFNLHELDRQFTPYVYTGLSLLIYDELFVVNGATEKDYTETTLAIPMTVGFKTNVFPKLVLGFEVGARYSFTDNLDGSNPKNDNLAPLRFGNTNSKDWYVFTGFTLTYTFTEKPCFCAE